MFIQAVLCLFNLAHQILALPDFYWMFQAGSQTMPQSLLLVFTFLFWLVDLAVCGRWWAREGPRRILRDTRPSGPRCSRTSGGAAGPLPWPQLLEPSFPDKSRGWPLSLRGRESVRALAQHCADVSAAPRGSLQSVFQTPKSLYSVCLESSVSCIKWIENKLAASFY